MTHSILPGLRAIVFGLGLLLTAGSASLGCFGNTGSIAVFNDSGRTVTEIYLAQSINSDINWGAERLKGVLYDGGAWNFLLLTATDWDVKAFDEEGCEYQVLGTTVVVGESSTVSINPQNRIACPEDATSASIEITNAIEDEDGPHEIHELRIATSSASEWSDDLLAGEAPISWGATLSIMDLTADVYDLNAVDELGRDYSIMGIDLGMGGTALVEFAASDRIE